MSHFMESPSSKYQVIAQRKRKPNNKIKKNFYWFYSMNTKKNNDPIPEKENRKRLHKDGTALNIIRSQFPQETECKRILTVITLAWKNFLHTVNAIPELFMHWTESVRVVFGLFFTGEKWKTRSKNLNEEKIRN